MQLGAGAILVGAVAATGCVVMVYGAPVECDTADCGTTSALEASAPAPDVSTPLSACYRPLPGDVPLAAPAELGADACTEDEAGSVARDCAKAAGPACMAHFDQNETCARCVAGGSAAALGIDATVRREGAILYLPTSGLRLPNTATCAALLSLRADCAAELADDAVCVSKSCLTCSTEGRAACVREARAAACGGKARSECLDAIEAARATWEPRCIGSDDEATLEKLAVVFCVSPNKSGSPRDASADTRPE